MDNITLLLTGCIIPNGMSITSVQDAKTRRKQYIEAISFYLSTTNIKIVFVENSNEDLSDLFKEAINSNRLEYITFDGNCYDKKRGKGYGEALILLKALRESKIIQDSKYLIKITGRIIVRNINQIIKQTSLLCKSNRLIVDFYGETFIPTMVFSFCTNHFYNFLQIHYEEIDDSTNNIFENLFYQYAKSNDLTVLPYIISPKLEGICGGMGKKYENRPFFKALEGNFYGASVLNRITGHKIKWFIFGCIYKLFHLFCLRNHYVYNAFIINPYVH